MKKNIKQYFYFLLVSYIIAFTFELIANTIGDGKLFESNSWLIVFLVWYGLIYSLTFILLSKKSLWAPVIVWAILGPIVEIFIFKRLNIIVDPIIYAIMFFIPFFIYHKYIKKN